MVRNKCSFFDGGWMRGSPGWGDSGHGDNRVPASLTFITGTSSIVSYILGGKYKAILSADQKMYVLYLLDIVVVIISCLFRVLLLINGFGIIAVQSVNLLTVGIKNAEYVIYVKKSTKK